MIGKIIVDGFKHLNPDPSDILYDEGKAFIEAVLSKDYTFVAHTYFNLPDAEELLKEIEKGVLENGK